MKAGLSDRMNIRFTIEGKPGFTHGENSAHRLLIAKYTLAKTNVLFD
jgi:hypothetical protein